MMCTAFFYGIHRTSTFDLAIVMAALIVLFAMTGIKRMITLCQFDQFLFKGIYGKPEAADKHKWLICGCLLFQVGLTVFICIQVICYSDVLVLVLFHPIFYLIKYLFDDIFAQRYIIFVNNPNSFQKINFYRNQHV